MGSTAGKASQTLNYQEQVNVSESYQMNFSYKFGTSVTNNASDNYKDKEKEDVINKNNNDKENNKIQDRNILASKGYSSRYHECEKIEKQLNDLFAENKNFLFDQKSRKYYKNQVSFVNSLDNQKKCFIDKIFPPQASSIMALDPNTGISIDPIKTRFESQHFNTNFDIHKVIWLRASEIFKNKSFKIFDNNKSINDAKEGRIGDSYFISAVSAVAEFPASLAQIFKTNTIQENGCYEIIIKINGEWKIILLDDYFPCNKETLQPIFAQPLGSANEIWLMLLEKAWAKVNGGYKNIITGNSRDVLSCFTCFPIRYIGHNLIISEADKKSFWQQVLNFNNKEIHNYSNVNSSKINNSGNINKMPIMLCAAVSMSACRNIINAEEEQNKKEKSKKKHLKKCRNIIANPNINSNFTNKNYCAYKNECEADQQSDTDEETTDTGQNYTFKGYSSDNSSIENYWNNNDSQGHIYREISCKEELVKSNKQQALSIKLLHLRNACANRKFAKKWNDSSKLYISNANTNDYNKKIFDYSPEIDDGNYCIEYENYLKYFLYTELAYFSDPYCCKTFKLENKQDMKKTSVFEIYIPNNDTQINFSVLTKSYRFNRKIPSGAYLPIRMILLRIESTENSQIKQNHVEDFKVIEDSYKTFDSHIIMTNLSQGHYFLVVKPHFERQIYDKDRKYTVEVGSTNFFGFLFKGLDEQDYIIRNIINKGKNKNTNSNTNIAFASNVVDQIKNLFSSCQNSSITEDAYNEKTYDFIIKNQKINFANLANQCQFPVKENIFGIFEDEKFGIIKEHSYQQPITNVGEKLVQNIDLTGLSFRQECNIQEPTLNSRKRVYK